MGSPWRPMRGGWIDACEGGRPLFGGTPQKGWENDMPNKQGIPNGIPCLLGIFFFPPFLGGAPKQGAPTLAKVGNR